MTDPSPSSSYQPFQSKAFRERSLLDSFRNKARDTDARAALETRLAEHGVASVTPAYTHVLLESFGVKGQKARILLMSLWKQALEVLTFNDSKLDAAENTYLDGLKVALGLTDEETSAVRTQVLAPEFLRRAELLFQKHSVAPETRDAISKEARNLRISASDEQSLLHNPARKALTATLQSVFARRRMSDEELKNILSFLDQYGMKFEGDEQNKLARCWHLSLLDRGTVPNQQVDIGLEKGEQCAFAGYSELYEIRKVRRSGVSYDTLQRIDGGPLYITTERVLFVGAIASKEFGVHALVNAFVHEQYLVLQKRSGKNHQFKFGTDLDLEAAKKTIDFLRSRDLSETTAKKGDEEKRTPQDGTPQQPIAASKKAMSGNTASPGPAAGVQELLSELDSLTGLEPVKREVRGLVNYLRVQRLRVEQGLPSGQLTVHLVFTGNPGTGKTTVARLLAKIYKAMGFLPEGHLVETDRSGLVGGYLGQTALKTSEVIKKALGGVLFIDEAYALARTVKGQEGDMYGTEAVDTLLKAMEDNRDQLIVIVAGYRGPMQQFLESNPGLRSRFTRYIDFPDYSPAELMTIFESMVAKAGYQLCDSARVRATALFEDAYTHRNTTFGNARLARTVFEEACVRLANRLASDQDITRSELTMFEAEDLAEAKSS